MSLVFGGWVFDISAFGIWGFTNCGYRLSCGLLLLCYLLLGLWLRPFIVFCCIVSKFQDQDQ